MGNDLVVKIKGALESPNSQTKLLSFFGDDKAKVTKFKSALISIAQNPVLSQCTPKSILESAFNLAETGLEISPILGQAYILKYKNDAEAVISYKGWMALIEKAGKRVKAYSVFKCDKFSIDLSYFEEIITFVPNYPERQESNDAWYKENILGVLVKIKDNKDGYVKNVFVTKDKIEKIKGKSPSAKSAYSPYNTWAEEMYLAKAIKYALSREALNFTDENIKKAVDLDNQLDMKLQEETRKENVESMQSSAESMQSSTEDVLETLINTDTGEVIQEQAKMCRKKKEKAKDELKAVTDVDMDIDDVLPEIEEVQDEKLFQDD